MPVACTATAANMNDTVLFERLFLATFAVMARIRTVFADRGYNAKSHRALCRGFSAEPQLGLPAIQREVFEVQLIACQIIGRGQRLERDCAACQRTVGCRGDITSQ